MLVNTEIEHIYVGCNQQPLTSAKILVLSEVKLMSHFEQESSSKERHGGSFKKSFGHLNYGDASQLGS